MRVGVVYGTCRFFVRNFIPVRYEIEEITFIYLLLLFFFLTFLIIFNYSIILER